MAHFPKSSLDLRIDVTEAAALGEEATVAATIVLPEPAVLGAPPVICFAKPGAGATRAYFTANLPGPGPDNQAAWHAERGWVFIALDHLGVGDSSTHHDAERLDFDVVTAANHAAEQALLERIIAGTLSPGYPPINEAVLLGIGHSMGAALTVSQQGRYHLYDGIASLGFSAIHNHPRMPPGELPVVQPWRLRDGSHRDNATVLNAARVEEFRRQSRPLDIQSKGNTWFFYYDDVDVEQARCGPWVSTTYPKGVTGSVLTPGVIAQEAAAVDVPVLVAMGERDTAVDPKGEPRAYLSATSVDQFVCPRMAHMHNFAGTRELLWQRIDSWGSWVTLATHTKRTYLRRSATP